MDFNKFIHIGTVRKAHGLNGNLDIRLKFPLKRASANHLPTIFIGEDENPLPYFLEQITHTTSEFYQVKLEDINHREDALKLCHQEIFIDEKSFDIFFDNQKEAGFEQFEGYTLLDENQKTIGRIEEVLELPGQHLAQIKSGNKEILIPLNKETIIRANRKTETVMVKIPEGLLDIY